MNSLFDGLGNLPHELGFGGFNCCETSSEFDILGYFPVKFPVCRQFGRRLARLALRRQPASPDFGEFPLLALERPANSGLFRHPDSLRRPESNRHIPKLATILQPTIEEFPFSGGLRQRPENKTTAWEAGSLP